MTTSIPSCIPAQITAGDTVTWRRAGGDYPASGGWVRHTTLVSASKVFSVEGTPDGDDFVFTVDAAVSAAWDADTYRATETATLASVRHTLATIAVRVLPDLAAVTTGMDTRTHAQKVLDSINGYLETKAPVYGAMELNGRKISYYPLADLLKLRDRYRREVRLELGGIGGARILAVL